jgi:predicted transposase YbfD/YdcC
MKNRTRSRPFRPCWNASTLPAHWSRSTPWDANPTIAQSIRDAEADYLLAVKDNQPTLHADIKSYFDTAPSGEVERFETLGKDHGRIELRAHTVSHAVDWIASERSYPGAPRFPGIATIAVIESRIERADKIEIERRSYISSRALSAERFADAVRSHWPSKTTFTGPRRHLP